MNSRAYSEEGLGCYDEPIIQTDRLILRQWSDEDFESFAEPKDPPAMTLNLSDQQLSSVPEIFLSQYRLSENCGITK